MEAIFLYAIPFLLCWGSFLNVLARRLITGESLLTPSHCPLCHASIAWYDNIPLISYVILRGRCRSCRCRISPLYPFIEAFTAIIMTLLLYRVFFLRQSVFSKTTLAMGYGGQVAEYGPGFSEVGSFLVYFIFFSALIVTIRTDLEFMLISRVVTLWLIPVGSSASALHFIPLAPWNSIAGATLGYGSLALVAVMFKKIMKKDGIGEGDFELMGLIGAFTGVGGVWTSIMIGSIAGTIIGSAYLYAARQRVHDTPLPFGPFLAMGAMIYILFTYLAAPIDIAIGILGR